MNINIIAVGKLRESWTKEACAEYQKRLSAYAKIKVTEPSPADLPQNPSRAEIEKALVKEAALIREQAKTGYKAALCVEGAEMSSEELARRLDDLANRGVSTVNFIIGSSFGLAESLKSECDLKLSMSAMTFPHELARVMLLEQIYRAYSILGNTKYHK